MTSGYRARPLPGRLPAEVTDFVGRRAEVNDVKRLLASTRLVTVTGVGGCGKTRLALRVAEEVRRGFTDGVWQVDLAPVTDPGLIVYAVADAVGLYDQTERLPVDVVVEFLADRQLLLVLDNCEHLLDGCAAFAGRALRDAPGLHLLCTSRQPLGVVGEQVWTVPPLAFPDPRARVAAGAAAQYPALALFASRAAAVAAGFSLSSRNVAAVAEICHRLDGLPLAIELAAARLRVLSVDQLATILRDGFPDLRARHAAPAWHHTLEAAFDWSYRLCSPAERVAWAQVSVFVDTFDLAAAEAIAGEDLLDQVAGLVDKSVLVREEDEWAGTRYRLLATVREYGLRRLREGGGEADLRRRHRDWCRRLAARLHADWFGPDQVRWVRRVAAEAPNLRAALDFCAGTPGEVGEGLALAADLLYFWCGSGRLHEAHHWYERLLAIEPATPDQARLRALDGIATVLLARGEIDASTARAFEATALAQQLTDPVAEPRAVRLLGTALMMGGDLDAAQAVLEDANERLTAIDDTAPEVGYVRLALANVVLRLDEPDLARAEDLLASCRAICRGRGEQWWLGYVLVSSAVVALAGHDIARATRYLRESLRSRHAMGDTLGIAGSLERLAWTAGMADDHERAARLLGAADRQWRTVGRTLYGAPSWMRGRLECRANALRAIGEPAFEKAYEDGALLTTTDAVRHALDAAAPVPDEPAAAAAAAPAPRLTPREREVAALVAAGLSNKEIAARLVVSTRTAESHVENILRKLGFTSRTQVAGWLAGGP